MKAITIWQPWASLIACGAKEFETRSWPTNYRGPIAIHAAKKPIDPVYYLDGYLEPFARAIGLPTAYDFGTLPYGSVIAVAELVGCLAVVKSVNRGYQPWSQLSDGRVIKGKECHFGNFGLGRYAWKLANVQMLPEPIPAKGMQRLWNWKEC